MEVSHPNDLWAMELPAGWRAHPPHHLGMPGDEPEAESVGLVPPVSQARCHIATIRGSSSPVPLTDWVKFAAHADRIRGADVQPVQAGVFQGYVGRVERDGTHWRVWWLEAGTLGLNVLYACSPDMAGLDDPDLDRMVSSLRLNRPAADRS